MRNRSLVTLLLLFTLTAPAHAGLVAWWRFAEGTGTSTAEAIGGYTGTLGNGATWSANSREGGQALSCDGTDDQVSVSDTAALDLVDNFSIALWVNATNWTGEGGGASLVRKNGLYILRKDDATPDMFFLFWDGAGSILQRVVVDTVPATGGWHHIVVTLSGNSTAAIYYDTVAQSVSSGTFGSASRDATQALIFCGDGAGGESYAGLLDEIRLYNHVLSPAEIAGLYRRGRMIRR